MQYKWFRLYSEFASDPKVQSMSEVMQRRLIMIFCLQSNGDLPKLSHEEIAFQLRIDDETLHETFQLFQAKGFIDKNHKITNWDKRQYKSDTSTERVKRHRRKSINNNDETQVKRFRNVTVTPPETETETETKKKQNKKELVLPEGITLPSNLNLFIQFRKEIRKPITQTQIAGLIEDAHKLAMESNCTPEEILQQSINKGWQGIFNLKKENINGRQSTLNRSPVTEYRNKDQRAKDAVARAAERLGFAPWLEPRSEDIVDVTPGT